MNDYDLVSVPDAIEPLVGYRGWLTKDGYLHSCYRDVRWPVGSPLRSECIAPLQQIHFSDESPPPRVSKHSFPIKPCTCGIYGLYEFPKLWEVREGRRQETHKPWPDGAVVGMVHGWGNTIVGNKGFRAEWAKPIALVKNTQLTSAINLLEQLAERYGLQIVTVAEVRNNGYRGRAVPEAYSDRAY